MLESTTFHYGNPIKKCDLDSNIKRDTLLFMLFLS